MSALDHAKRPLPWAILSGAGLIIALVIDPTAPGWLFWGAVALSCLGAFVATWLDH